MEWINRLGLFLNAVGVTLMAFSIAKYNKADTAYTTDEKGKRSYIAHINHPKLLRFGLFFVITGFLCQLVSSFI